MNEKRDEIQLNKYLIGGALSILLIFFGPQLAFFGRSGNPTFVTLFPIVIFFVILGLYVFIRTQKNLKSYIIGFFSALLAILLFVVLFFIEIAIHPPSEE